jgi:hypothetical protein
VAIWHSVICGYENPGVLESVRQEFEQGGIERICNVHRVDGGCVSATSPELCSGSLVDIGIQHQNAIARHAGNYAACSYSCTAAHQRRASLISSSLSS